MRDASFHLSIWLLQFLSIVWAPSFSLTAQTLLAISCWWKDVVKFQSLGRVPCSSFTTLGWLRSGCTWMYFVLDWQSFFTHGWKYRFRALLDQFNSSDSILSAILVPVTVTRSFRLVRSVHLLLDHSNAAVSDGVHGIGSRSLKPATYSCLSLLADCAILCAPSASPSSLLPFAYRSEAGRLTLASRLVFLRPHRWCPKTPNYFRESIFWDGIGDIARTTFSRSSDHPSIAYFSSRLTLYSWFYVKVSGSCCVLVVLSSQVFHTIAWLEVSATLDHSKYDLAQGHMARAQVSTTWWTDCSADSTHQWVW